MYLYGVEDKEVGEISKMSVFPFVPSPFYISIKLSPKETAPPGKEKRLGAFVDIYIREEKRKRGQTRDFAQNVTRG